MNCSYGGVDGSGNGEIMNKRNKKYTPVVEEGPVTPFLCGGMLLTFGGIH